MEEEEKEDKLALARQTAPDQAFSFSKSEDNDLSISKSQLPIQEQDKELNEQTPSNGNPIKEELLLKVGSIQNENQSSQPPPQEKKKRDLGLWLPVQKISLVAKEVPLDSSLKKKSKPSSYDNFHEYAVFCDVTMKKGSRDSQQDRFQAVNPIDNKHKRDSFFAVYDGHGTFAVADTLKEILHKYISSNENYPKDIIRSVKESFQKIDEEILAKQRENQICSGGSTALCCLIREDQLYIINCGDSSSVRVTKDYAVDVLNNLHKPSMKGEAERLDQQNTIYTDQRVMDALGVTRSFGDYKHKNYIISEPEISVYKIDENSKYCLLGTDGFWDIIKPSDLPELLRNIDQVEEGQRSSLKDLSTVLVEYASGIKTQQKKDNMTLLAIDLDWFYKQYAESKFDEDEVDSVPEMNQNNNEVNNRCVIQLKSQLNLNTSSFVFSAKSPHSVGRSTEKKFSLQSVGNPARIKDLNLSSGPKTCFKSSIKQIFFGDEEPLIFEKASNMTATEPKINESKDAEHFYVNGNTHLEPTQLGDSPVVKEQPVGSVRKKAGNFFDFK